MHRQLSAIVVKKFTTFHYLERVAYQCTDVSITPARAFGSNKHQFVPLFWCLVIFQKYSNRIEVQFCCIKTDKPVPPRIGSTFLHLLIMTVTISRIRVVQLCVATVGLCTALNALATGVQPDTTLLAISENSGGQMGVKNTDNEPVLLHTTIVDMPDSKGVLLHAVPPVTRLEANGYQVVRFILEKPEKPLTVQVLKRVRFEGIPPASKAGTSSVRMTVGQDLPVVISPKDLEQNPEPWKLIHWSLVGNKIVGKNSSPYVARMAQEASLLPSEKTVKLLERPYMLPGDSVEMELPSGTDPTNVKGLRITPGSPYGFAVAPFEVVLKP